MTARTLRFANPLDGGWATPTIANWMTHLPAGFATAPVRSTDAMLVAVSRRFGEHAHRRRIHPLARRDFLSVPNWTWRSLEAGPRRMHPCSSPRTGRRRKSSACGARSARPC